MANQNLLTLFWIRIYEDVLIIPKLRPIGREKNSVDNFHPKKANMNRSDDEKSTDWNLSKVSLILIMTPTAATPLTCHPRKAKCVSGLLKRGSCI